MCIAARVVWGVSEYTALNAKLRPLRASPWASVVKLLKAPGRRFAPASSMLMVVLVVVVTVPTVTELAMSPAAAKVRLPRAEGTITIALAAWVAPVTDPGVARLRSPVKATASKDPG